MNTLVASTTICSSKIVIRRGYFLASREPWDWAAFLSSVLLGEILVVLTADALPKE